MKCPDCGAKTFHCPRCNSEVPVEEFVDIFHMGRCPVCKSIEDEHCPDHLEEVFGPQTRWQLVKAVGREIARRVPWARVSTWVGLLATAAWALRWLL